MWNFMDHNQEVFVDSTKEGLDKVLTEKYAFLLESTMNAYVTQRNCELMQVGGLLDAKGYGIATPRGRLLHGCFSTAGLHGWRHGVAVGIHKVTVT